MSKFPLEPGSTIGILGGGQLGRMLSAAAGRLGFDVAILDPEPDSPAGRGSGAAHLPRVSAHAIVAAYDDAAGLKALADISAIVTYEFENVPAEAVAKLAAMGVEV